MTIADWILLALFIINYGLIIFANLKKLIILQKTCACLTLPLAGTIIILRLTNYLPDSFHIIIVSVAAFILISISTAFLAFEKIRSLRILGKIASLGNIVCWITLYNSIFKIHSVPAWFIGTWQVVFSPLTKISDDDTVCNLPSFNESS